MADRPFDGVDTRRRRAKLTDVEKEIVIDPPFSIKGRHIIADRLARNLSARQVQMIGSSGHGCSHTEPLLIMIL
jgi:hypothetical protein